MQVAKLYRQAPLKSRFFLFCRWHLTPYCQMFRHLPEKGRILDLGCGHGLFALLLAKTGPCREILGVDHDFSRIAIAKIAGTAVPNVQFLAGDLMSAFPADKFQGISIIDTLHYFSPIEQKKILQSCCRSLTKGGVLVVREVNPAPSSRLLQWIALWNQLYERFMTKIGFTEITGTALHFRSTADWLQLLDQSGFSSSVHERCSNMLFADELFIAQK